MIALLLGSALAYDTTGAQWAALPVTVHLAAETGDLDVGAVEEALVAAIAAWNEGGCAEALLVYGGRVEGATPGAQDGQNVAFFLSSGWTDDPGLLTTPYLFVDGSRLGEADVALNGQSYAWSTEDADGTSVFDVQAGFTHELGHLLGLWHSAEADATLNPALAGNPAARSLAEDDIAGICALYPAGSASGEGELGDPCEDTAQCAEGLFCLADGADRYCSQDCADDADCPGGFACLEAEGSGACALEEAEKGGCGCASGGSAGGALGAALLAALGLRWRGGRPRGRRSCRSAPR